MDFDTVFSAYIQNKTLIFHESINNLNIILPTINNIELVFTEIINSISTNSLLVIDSLNGLTDCLNLLNISKLKIENKNSTTNTTSSSSSLVSNKLSARYSYASYQSFNILLLLLKKMEVNNIPIIVTKYQTLERSHNMILELLTTKDFETNHFIRISNLVLFLDFDQIECKTEITLLKKIHNDILSFPLTDENNATMPITTEQSANSFSDLLYPYSRWFYFKFFDQNL